MEVGIRELRGEKNTINKLQLLEMRQIYGGDLNRIENGDKR